MKKDMRVYTIPRTRKGCKVLPDISQQSRKLEGNKKRGKITRERFTIIFPFNISLALFCRSNRNLDLINSQFLRFLYSQLERGEIARIAIFFYDNRLKHQLSQKDSLRFFWDFSIFFFNWKIMFIKSATKFFQKKEGKKIFFF